eukprot:2873349-Karenia_brevis.AAC.1
MERTIPRNSSLCEVSTYLWNFSANTRTTSRANTHPKRRSRPCGAKSSRDDDDMTQAQPDNQSKDESGHPKEFAQPSMTVDCTHCNTILSPLSSL